MRDERYGKKPKSFRRHLRELKPCTKCGARMEPLEGCKSKDKRCPGLVPL